MYAHFNLGPRASKDTLFSPRSCGGWTTTRLLVLAICLSVSAPMTLFAWLYPEHRDIALLGLEMLEPEQRSLLGSYGPRLDEDTRAAYVHRWAIQHKG
jgi:hypothetical protein